VNGQLLNPDSAVKDDMSCCVVRAVSEADKQLPSPFTQAPTASLIFEKEKQAKERAIPPSQSKLRKCREKLETPVDKVSLSDEHFHLLTR